MANKRYDQFTAGTYDTAKIFLQADAATGALEKIFLPSINNYTGTANRITVTGTVIDIAATYVGQASITTLGTIGTGTWNATTIGIAKGGTNLTTYSTGDILYASAANVLSKLAAGSNGQVLTLAAGIPSWGSGTTGWGLTGNAGTTAGTNFIGTTDNISFVIKTNNTTRVTVDNTGVVTSAGNISAVGATIGFPNDNSIAGAAPTNAIQANTLCLFGFSTNQYKIGLTTAFAMYFQVTAGREFLFFQSTTQTNARIDTAGNFSQIGGGQYSMGSNPTLANPTAADQAHTYAYLNSGTNAYKTGLAASRASKFDIYWQTGATSGGGFRWYTGTNELASITAAGNLLINTATDIASSKLTIASTTQGFLTSRMTTTQRDAISSPAAGLLIYNTSTNKLNVFTTAWEIITSL